jgi:hypothetical protein
MKNVRVKLSDLLLHQFTHQAKVTPGNEQKIVSKRIKSIKTVQFNRSLHSVHLNTEFSAGPMLPQGPKLPQTTVLKITELLVVAASALSHCAVARGAVGHWLVQNYFCEHIMSVCLFVCQNLMFLLKSSMSSNSMFLISDSPTASSYKIKKAAEGDTVPTLS